MNSARLKRLQAAGWKIGSAKDFLKLSDEEATLVELKLSSPTPSGGPARNTACRRSTWRRKWARANPASPK